jgi:hypothetical protein
MVGEIAHLPRPAGAHPVEIANSVRVGPGRCNATQFKAAFDRKRPQFVALLHTFRI